MSPTQAIELNVLIQAVKKLNETTVLIAGESVSDYWRWLDVHTKLNEVSALLASITPASEPQTDTAQT